MPAENWILQRVVYSDGNGIVVELLAECADGVVRSLAPNYKPVEDAIIVMGTDFGRALDMARVDGEWSMVGWE